jgi:hypothetical protein
VVNWNGTNENSALAVKNENRDPGPRNFLILKDVCGYVLTDYTTTESTYNKSTVRTFQPVKSVAYFQYFDLA